LDSQLIIPKESKASLKTTWNIYKSHWKTFLVLTGLIFAISVIYSIIDFIISAIGIVPLNIETLAQYESLAIGTFLASLIIRAPLYFIYYGATSLLTVLYMVIPALYFKNNEKITWKVPYKVLKRDFKRYLLAGILYYLSVLVGLFACIIPGVVISFIGPTYLNKIACSDMPIFKAFTSSFQAVFKSTNFWPYIGMQLLASIIFIIPTVCTCFIGSIITFPMLSIYSIHLAYNKGIIN
jgi:hypothetical protein